jgi:ribonuclease BN (tRNA processing enzyme)
VSHRRDDAYTRREFVQAGAAAMSVIPLARSLSASRSSTQAPAARDKSRLILLGTAGGPTPKPARAQPAQVIVINGDSYVVDCGNGVARQMILAGLRLGSIRNVFLTHMHSDHAADYGNLLLIAWASDLATRVDTWGPPSLDRMTRLFLEMNDPDIQVRMRESGRPPLAPLIVPHELGGPGLVMQDDNVKVTAALVDHGMTKPAYAFRFDCPDRSIVISGDTVPSPALVELARGADVLVHEVMYLPAIEAMIAREPNATRLREHLVTSHTTTDQVGKVATEAGVKTLVLTHFVPGGDPTLTDQVWYDAVNPHFKGELIVGRDLLEV